MSQMTITELRLGGFKGRNFTLPLGGRDLVVAGNMIGKTSLVQAFEFVSTGSISGVKREGLMSFCTKDSFYVGLTAKNGEGQELRVTRQFKVTKTGGTKMILKFNPEGLEDNLKEAEERLAAEFKDSPLVTFDLRAFLMGDDTDRLETCMGFAPKSAAGSEEATAVIEKVKGEGDDTKAFDAVKAELLGFTGPLPDDALERFQALSQLLEKWAKTTRAEVTQKTKSIRQLGEITREAGVKSGANVESLNEQKEAAQESLRDLEAAQAKSDERRDLIKEERETLAKLQLGELKAVEGQEKAAHDVEAAEDSLAKSSDARATALAEKETWGKKEEVRAKLARDDVAACQRVFDEAMIVTRAAEQKLKDADAALESGRGDLQKLERLANLTSQALAYLEIDGADGSCPVCAKTYDQDERASLIVQLMAEQQKSDPAQQQRQRVDGLRSAHAVTGQEREDAVRAADAARELHAKAEHAAQPVPFNSTVIDRAEKAVSTEESFLERMHGDLKVAEANLVAAKKAAVDSNQRIGDLAVNLPEDMVAGAIEGGKMEVERIEVQIRTVEANRHRFEDQERLRRELAEQEQRLEALKLWRSILGLKGITGEWLSKTIGVVLEPARELVRRVIPDAVLGISWETPRGKPGLRIELRRGEMVSAYDSMSGAERAIVGAALLLAFAGVKNPPAHIATECEVMDENTQAAYLAALENLAGPSGLLVTTHHGGGDIGTFKATELTAEDVA